MNQRNKIWVIALMILGIVLLPSYLTAEITQANTSILSTNGDNAPTIKLSLPFDVPSQWTGADSSAPGINWSTGDSITRFAINNGRFTPTQPTDTWFVYGWFGPLEAIQQPYNIKYPQWGNRHNGIDFAGQSGLPVVSSSGGVVAFAGTKIGNTVIIDAGNGYRVTYGHLLDIQIEVGDRVNSGTLIGHLGNTGTTNPHLHFQIDHTQNGVRTAINPVSLLIDTAWSDVITPNADANRFYAGPENPAKQPNFIW